MVGTNAAVSPIRPGFMSHVKPQVTFITQRMLCMLTYVMYCTCKTDARRVLTVWKKHRTTHIKHRSYIKQDFSLFNVVYGSNSLFRLLYSLDVQLLHIAPLTYVMLVKKKSCGTFIPLSCVCWTTYLTTSRCELAFYTIYIYNNIT